MRVGEGGWGVNTFYYTEIVQQSISYDWEYIIWPLVLLLLFIRFNSVILFINTCAFFFSIFHLYEWDFSNCIEHLHVLHVFQSNPLKYKWILKRIVDMVYVHEWCFHPMQLGIQNCFNINLMCVLFWRYRSLDTYIMCACCSQG